MTEQEVFNKIISQHKWYAGYCSKQHANNIKVRFLSGSLTAQSVKKLFDYFGYEQSCGWSLKKNENKFA